MTNKSETASSNTNALRDKFFVILMQDVMRSFERARADDCQASRRDLIRTMFAAIEGSVWEYREHVRSTVDTVAEISPIMALALSETSYTVSETGKLTEQKRFISIIAMIRLLTRIAEENCAGLKVDFSDVGWSSLKQGIIIRNRITHPKRQEDLNIVDDDIETSKAGFFWLLNMIVTVMAATNERASQYLDNLRLFTQQLKNGDPKALAAYQTQLLSNRD